MLDEAIRLIRTLWSGNLVTEWTEHYEVDRARLYTVPETPPPIGVAAASPAAARLAGKAGDALIATAPDEELVRSFREAGGAGNPAYGQVTICWGPDAAKAKDEALEWWPNTSVPGELGVELVEPQQFEQVAQLVTAEKVAEKVVCGPDPGAIAEQVRAFVDVGFDHVFLHQVGPRQEEFLGFAKNELLPAVRQEAA
jgi:G6PDH family F420-dependent oxidoreductase